MQSEVSFSIVKGGFTYIMYPKKRTMPNLAIRHNHTNMLPDARRGGRVALRKSHSVRNNVCDHCHSVAEEADKKEAIQYLLSKTDFEHETVTFLKPLKQLSSEWYIRRYNNTYTKGDIRYVFYHQCKSLCESTYAKGLYDHLLPYLKKPFACQTCGVDIPKALLMAVSIQRANITL